MGPLLVIFHTPAFQDDPSFKEGAEVFPVEAFIAELVMEAFDVAVFPWGARRDVDGFDLLGSVTTSRQSRKREPTE